MHSYRQSKFSTCIVCKGLLKYSTMTEDKGSIFNLQVDEQSSYYLKETAKWAKFLGVVGLVFTGLFIIGAFAFIVYAFQSESGAFNSIGVAPLFAYMILILIYVYPIYSIFAFGKKMKQALTSHNQILLNSSLKNLKNSFLFMGITTLIFIFFYLIIFVIFAFQGANNLISG